MEDRETLGRVMTAVDAPRSPLKPLLSRAAERAGRLKLNGRIRSYSPLSRLLELEALVGGVTVKRALWRALGQSADPRLRAFDFGDLERRAEGQLELLERHRLDAARAVVPAAAAGA
jgi:broad specificity phosphatase PhoE